MADVINFTTQQLNNMEISTHILKGVTVRSSSDENSLAEKLKGILERTISKEQIDAHVYSSSCKTGNMIHPLLRVSNPKYGKIGILINKNLVMILFLSGGATSNARAQKEEYERAANANLEQSINGNYEGCCGCLEQIGNFSRMHTYEKEAKKIEYDPTEERFEAAWQQEVIECIKACLSEI